jgi:hypothetical protein
VCCARFSADAQTVVYAQWGSRPMEVFSTRLDSVEPRALGFQGRVAATTSGEMAVILPNATLARLPLDGGAPREIAEHAYAADWGPDGSMAVIREQRRVEFPLGHLFYEGSFRHPPPRRARVATG